MKRTFTIDKITSIRAIQFSPMSYLEPTHWHDCMEIGYCLSGGGWFYFGDKKYRVQPGDVFVVNHLERHVALSDEDDPSTFLFVLFEMVTIEQTDPDLTMFFMYNPDKFDNRIPAGEPLAEEIGGMIKTIWQEQQQKQPAYPKVMKSLLLLICSLLARYGNTTGQGQHAQKDHFHYKYTMIQKALHFIKSHFHEDLKLEDVAAQLSLSPSRTRHLFYETIGEGFKAYLLHTRINEAKRLLIHSPLSITDIYLQCGFQSTASFYRVFHNYTDLSPVEYRKRSLSLVPKDNMVEF